MQACWASWADALHMIAGRLPEVANRVEGCLAEVSAAAGRLDRQGFVGRPSWADLKEGVRPPISVFQEPGEWQHGWQHHASSASEYHFRETVMIAQSCAADQAHLRSHSGPGSGEVFHGSPTQVEFQLPERVRRKARPSGTPQGSMCPIGSVEEQSDAH